MYLCILYFNKDKFYVGLLTIKISSWRTGLVAKNARMVVNPKKGIQTIVESSYHLHT